MRLAIVAMAAALALCGCGKSSVDLLKAGDPQVCTKSDVKDELVSIIKQNGSPPPNNGLIADYDNLAPEWLKSVSIAVDTITSKEVDAPNQKITCNATVHMTASGVEKEQMASVDYQVTADLSAGKPIVSVAVGDSKPALDRLLAAAAAPAFDKANAEEAAKSASRLATLEAAWAKDHSEEIANMRAVLDSPRAAIHYPPKIRDEIIRYELLKDQTRPGGEWNDDKRLLLKAAEFSHTYLGQNGACNPSYSEWSDCNGGPSVRVKASDGGFNGDQDNLIKQFDDLHDKCRDGGPDSEQACSSRDALSMQMKAQGMCYGPDDAIEAEKHWQHCAG